jgi:hypothetical protein
MTIAEAGRTTLMDFLIEAGIQRLCTVLEQERTHVCGPRHEHRPLA